MPTIESVRPWYARTDPVHGFDHVLRVYRLAEYIAKAEGADLQVVRAAALLHDLQARQVPLNSALVAGGDESQRGNHHLLSAEIAAQILLREGWERERVAQVAHCIRAHRFRDDSEPPRTLEAEVLFDADKLDAIGAVGVVRAVAFAIQAGQPVFAAPSQSFLESGRLEDAEPHSAYHEYVFKLRRLKGRLRTPTAQKLAEARHDIMERFFEALGGEMSGSFLEST